MIFYFSDKHEYLFIDVLFILLKLFLYTMKTYINYKGNKATKSHNIDSYIKNQNDFLKKTASNHINNWFRVNQTFMYLYNKKKILYSRPNTLAIQFYFHYFYFFIFYY